MTSTILEEKTRSMKRFYDSLNLENKRAFLNQCRKKMKVKTHDSVRQYISGSRQASDPYAKIMEGEARRLCGDEIQIWD